MKRGDSQRGMLMTVQVGRFVFLWAVITGFSVASIASVARAEGDRKPPYWASIVPSKARTRTGPGRNFPASWLYQRAGLPVQVVETYPNWRKIQDPDGERGWMQANMLSEKRTAIVKDKTIVLRQSADASAKILWRAEAGVVGKIRKCHGGWCLFDSGGKAGYAEIRQLYGVAPDENVE